MEDDESNSPSEQEDTQIHSEYTARLVENIAGFRQCVKEMNNQIGGDENFNEVTAESYNAKKAYVKTRLIELSFFHNTLADEHILLLEELRKKSSSVTKMEEEVLHLNKRIQCLKDENNELKNEIAANETDIRVYMSKTKQEMKAMEAELKKSKENAKKIEEQKAAVLQQKAYNESMHESEIRELKMKVYHHLTEMSHLHSIHVKKENIWDDVTDKLMEDMKGKGELVDEMSKNMEALVLENDEVHGQLETLWGDIVIQQLKTDLNSHQSHDMGVVLSIDSDVEEVISELKVKMVELEREVKSQREVISG